VFTEAGIDMDVRSDLVTFLWQKLLTVGPRSVLVTLGRTTVGYFSQVPDALPLYEALLREYFAVGRAEGADLQESQIEGQLKSASGGTAGPVGGPGQMPSLQRDAENRRWLEVDEMIGAVGRLGRAHGIPTPVTDVLCTLLRLQDVTNRDRMAQAAR
jgi:2-dehydropantoate 2-reductase